MPACCRTRIMSSAFSPSPLAVAATALTGLLVDVAVVSPAMLGAAFNPVSLNVAGLALCAVAWHARQRNARPGSGSPGR